MKIRIRNQKIWENFKVFKLELITNKTIEEKERERERKRKLKRKSVMWTGDKKKQILQESEK